MFNIEDMGVNLSAEKIEELANKAREELEKGRPIERLLEEHKAKYSFSEAFLILMHAKIQSVINPENRNFTGKMRK